MLMHLPCRLGKVHSLFLKPSTKLLAGIKQKLTYSLTNFKGTHSAMAKPSVFNIEKMDRVPSTNFFTKKKKNREEVII
jgi:hypothetical protein